MSANLFAIPNSEMSLEDLLNLHKTIIMNAMYCHGIGTIQSFDAVKNTAIVKMNYLRTNYVDNGKGEYVAQGISYPLLVDCPVVTYNGGGGYLTFPIAAGDECVVLFNDKDMDGWWAGSSNSLPQSNRSHAFTDALVLVGPKSKSTALANYLTDRSVWTYGGGKITLRSKINISNQSQSLSTALNLLNSTLLTMVQAMSVASNTTQVAAAASGAISGISSAKSQIEGLLE